MPDDVTPPADPVEENVDLTAPLDDQPGDPSVDPVDPVEPVVPETPAVPDNFRDMLSNQGVDLSGYQDDSSAMEHVAKQINEAQQIRQQSEQLGEMAKYGQQYLENAGDFQQYMAEKAKLAEQAPVDPYSPPEMSPAWLNQVERNDRGELTPINGGTAETAAKVQKWLQWKSEFDANPYKHMESFVDRRAEEKAKGLVESEIGKIREQLTAEMFVSNNRNWLFDEGKFDQKGQPTLTERGAAFARLLSQGTESGLSGTAAQNMAMQQLQQWDEVQTLKAQIAGGTPAAPTNPEAQKEAFLENAAGHGPNHDASTNPPAVPPSQQPPQNENMSLADQMRAEMKKAKITDEQISGLLV